MSRQMRAGRRTLFDPQQGAVIPLSALAAAFAVLKANINRQIHYACALFDQLQDEDDALLEQVQDGRRKTKNRRTAKKP